MTTERVRRSGGLEIRVERLKGGGGGGEGTIPWI